MKAYFIFEFKLRGGRNYELRITVSKKLRIAKGE